jgi:hypothetical protein
LGPVHRRWKRWLAIFAAVSFLVVGLWVAWSFLRPNPKGFGPTAGAAAPVIDAPALRQFTVDARSRQEWAFFDFSTGAVVSTTQGALDWDIAFRRTDILLNGGATNPAGFSGAVDLGKVALAAADPPETGYAADVEHEERGLENPEMHAWYTYNWTTHIVSSKEHTYAARTADGERTFLLTFLSYYCDDRSAGCVTFRYLEVE